MSEGETLPTVEAWRRARGSYIGGSDVGAILGLSPYRNIGEVWLEKVRALEALETDDATADQEVSNRFTVWGRRLEPVVLDQYEYQTGFTLTRQPLTLYRHPELPFVGGTLDAEAVTPAGDRRVVEVKTTDNWTQYRTQMWGADGSDEIPEWYLLQGMQYMIVRGMTMCDFPVLIGGSDFRIFHLQFDAELAAMMLEAETDFWKKVEKREPPAFDYRAKGAYELQRKIWNQVEAGPTLTVPPDYRHAPSAPTIVELLIELDDASDALEHDKARLDAAKAELANLAGNNAAVRIGSLPLGINRRPKKGYSVAAYEVDASIELSMEPRTKKKRKELLDAFRKEARLP